MKYKLGDITIKEFNSWDRVPRDPVTIGAAIIGGGTAATGVMLAAQFVVGYLVTTAVTSWVMSALAPKPNFGAAGSSGILVNTRDAAAPQDFVYGEIRKGGVVTYYETTGDKNKFLHQIIVLAGHELNSIGDIYINDTVATLENDYVTTVGTGDDAIDYESKIFIKKFTGASGQNVKSTIDAIADFDGPTLPANFRGDGIACLYVRYEYDQDKFPNGVPLITAKVQGKKVLDPRTSTTAYSNNAALCIRDFLTSSYGLNDSAIDDVVFSAAANECDEDVSLDGGGTEKRYTINGVIQANRSTGDVLQDLVTACAGTLFWGTGSWKLKVGAYSSPVKTLTLDDLRGPITLDTRITMRDNFNTVSGTFIDADQDWITADYPTLASSTFKTEDGGEEVKLDLPLPYTTSAATAQRLAKLTLFRGREQMTLSADFGLEAMEVEVGDIIAFTNDRYGFDEKEFEVIGWRLAANQDAGDLRITLTLRETSQAAFSWSAEETAIISNNTNLPIYTAGTQIFNLSVGEGGRTQSDGTRITTALLDWDDVESAFIERYEVQWKPTSDSRYSTTFTTNSNIELSPIIDGVEYTFRVRAITVSGFRGDFASVTLTGGGDTTAPSVPTGLSATGGFGYINLSWTNPPQPDFSHVLVYENTTNNSSTATNIARSSGTSYVRANLNPNSTRYYWLKSVDLSGNTSGFSSVASGTSTFVDDADFEDGVRQIFIDAGLDVIEPVSSLPASGDFTGQQVFLTTDNKIYYWDGNSWETVVAAVDTINTDDIADAAITAAKIGSDAVTTAKLANNAVTEAIVAAGAITNTKIGNDAITTAKIAANAVTASEIAAGSITSSEIASNTITAGNIAAGAVTASEIAAGAVTAGKVAASAITADNIASNAITSAKIAANTITASDIAANTITGGLLATSGIITSAAQINSAVVTNAKIANGAITTAKISDGEVTNAKIGNTIQSSNYSAGSTGWKINKNGDAEFNGVVISRQLRVDNGSQYIGDVGSNSADTPQAKTSIWIETDINVNAWGGTQKSYIVAIGNTGTVTALTSDVNNNPTLIKWGFRGSVVPLTRWSGAAKLWVQAVPYIANVTSTNLTLQWNIYEVT